MALKDTFSFVKDMLNFGWNTLLDKPVMQEMTENGASQVVDSAMTFRKTETGTYTYLGEAIPGSATNSAVWRICRMNNVDGTIVWADGNGDFDNVWDDHATLTYS